MASYKKQLQALGYKYDENNKYGLAGYTKINGFSFFANIMPGSETLIVSSSCKPQSENGFIELNKYLQQFSVDRKKTVNFAYFKNNTISISYRMGIASNITKYVKEATDAIMYFAGQCGCIPVCHSCGQPVNTDFYSIGGETLSLCSECFSQKQGNIMAKAQTEAETVTNFPLGILGAALGGLIGAVLWIIFSMMGRIVFLAGIAASVGGFIGFQKLGKKMNVAGLIVSTLISLLMLGAGMYFSLGIDVYNAFKETYEISFSQAFSFIPFVFEDPEIRSAVIHDWVIGLITFIIPVIIFVLQFFHEKKVKNQALRLG